MSSALIGEPYYNKHMSWIDSIGFAATGCIALAQLRAFEWIPFPLSHTEMALAGIVNGLTSTLAYRLGNGDEAPTPYHKIALTVLGISLGVITFPFITLKLLKSRASLITPGPVLRVALFHLATKFCLEKACNLGEKYYEKLNFPIFQDFENMPPREVGIFYNHFNEQPEAWKKTPFTKQLRFNQALLKHNLQPLQITSVELTTPLTKTELETFRKLHEGNPLSKQQATLLYNFHVAPNDQVKNMPDIDPLNAKVHTLSDEQVRWHHLWFVQFYSDTVPQTQVEAFAQRFYDLDLPPPHPEFVADIPFQHFNQVTSKAKALYHYGFYKTHPDAWDNLDLRDQIFRRKFLDNYHFVSFSLKEPLIDEIPFLEKPYLQEFKSYFEKHPEIWNKKLPAYQVEFEKALQDHQIAPMNIPKEGWSKKEIAKTVTKYLITSVITAVVLYVLKEALSQADQSILQLAENKQRLLDAQNFNHSDHDDLASTAATCVGVACQNLAENISSIATTTHFTNTSTVDISNGTCPLNSDVIYPLNPFDVDPASMGTSCFVPQACETPLTYDELFSAPLGVCDANFSPNPFQSTGGVQEGQTPTDTPSPSPTKAFDPCDRPCFPEDEPLSEYDKSRIQAEITALNWISYGINGLLGLIVARQQVRRFTGY